MVKDTISRRVALKRIGASMVGAAVATSGISSFSSCGSGSRHRIILYFTGTGNCLHVARQLAGDNAELLSIPQMIRQGRYDFDADEIGIVYPIYGHMPPYMVREFIGKAKLSAAYKFSILTYGARKCDAVETWDKIASKGGIKFDYINTLIMVDNWLPNFDMNEQIKIDKHIPENLQKISADLAQQKHWHEPVTDEERQQHREFMARTGLNAETGFLMKSEEHFTVSPACIDCCICTYVCPRGNYELTSKGIKVEGSCEFCFACIQNCPQKAIQFIKHDDGSFPDGTEKNPNARYRNENISLMDIKLANDQNH